MAQGGVTNNVTSGGGATGPGGSEQAKTVICLNTSPGGTPLALYQLASSASIKAALGGIGPLAEDVAKLLQHGAPSVYACPVTPATVGALSSAVTAGGANLGAGTIAAACAPHVSIKILCSTGGTIGTAAFQFSLDGGVTYSAPVTSVASAPWTYRVPGTFCTLSFAAATYVATKTCTIGVDGVVTNGSLWVGVVTQASSPIGNYDFLVTIAKGGALGVAVISVSPDNGASSMPSMLVPASGVVVLPNMGIYLTLASTFSTADTYTFLAIPPSCSTSDVTAAMNALAAMTQQSATPSPLVALIQIGVPIATASGAISMASSVQTAIDAANTNGKNWQGTLTAPFVGDAVVSSTAIVDVADTEAALRTARVGSDFKRTSVWVGSHRQTSAITGFKCKVPAHLVFSSRYVEADPNHDVSEVGRGSLDVFALGRDEASAASTLYDAQFCTLTTYPTEVGAYVTIEGGGYGWRNMTSDPNYQDSGAVRVLNIFLAAIYAASIKYLGTRPQTDADGTIAEGPRQRVSGVLDKAGKQSVGLAAGGQFTAAQASLASAEVLKTSQLGQSPNRLDVQYVLQRLGFVSGVQNNVLFAGVLPVT
jgi:hypothetical protein